MNRRAPLCTGLLVSLMLMGLSQAFAADTPGANPNQDGKDGRTALDWAAMLGHASVVASLKSGGAKA